MEQMKAMEMQAEDQLVVMISEIHLDKPIVLEQFRKILSGFEQNGIAPLYVMIGSFFSKSYFKVSNGKEIMKQQFNRLADVIVDFPGQQECAKFIFVPGPQDAGSNVAMPRKTIPELLVESLKNRVNHIAFASNPCRIRCFTQEIVVFREDLMKKMQRHLAIPLSLDNPELSDMNEQLVQSICAQGHLCPLPAHARPIHWELDHAMRLFPLPDMVSFLLHIFISIAYGVAKFTNRFT
jgi:DNA polymerase epsilon subunit 2